MTRYYIHDEDGYARTAEVDETQVTVTSTNGCTDSLTVDGDNYVYKSINMSGKVIVHKVPGYLVYELPLLVTLLAKHSSMMSPVTIVEAGKITKLFQED